MKGYYWFRRSLDDSTFALITSARDCFLRMPFSEAVPLGSNMLLKVISGQCIEQLCDVDLSAGSTNLRRPCTHVGLSSFQTNCLALDR
jgi:hypothetical protein